MVTKFFVILTFLSLNSSYADMKFCTLATVEKSIVIKKMTPFVSYLQKELNQTIDIYVGRDYQDTLDRLKSGFCSISYIGAAPYLKVKNNIELVGVILADSEDSFHSDIVTRVDSKIDNLSDLNGASFAFGSPESTLSFYVPAYILIESELLDKLEKFNFLNSHDRVAKNVILGIYDAGAIKHSVFLRYKKYLKTIQASQVFNDFSITVDKNLSKNFKEKLKKVILNLKDKSILNSLKRGAIKFVEVERDSYQNIEEIVETVEQKFKKRDTN